MLTFREFLDAELDGLVRFAGVLTGDRDQAHDTLADALERAQRRWDRIGRMEYPAAYVRRIVTSVFVSERRRWSVRMVRPTRSGAVPDRVAADPTRAVDDRSHIAQLLATLPPRQRAVVVLGYYLGLSNREIAAELNITAGAVRTAHSEAMRKLRIVVDPRAPDGSPGNSPAGSPGNSPDGSPGNGPADGPAGHPAHPSAPSPPLDSLSKPEALHGMSSYITVSNSREQQ